MLHPLDRLATKPGSCAAQYAGTFARQEVIKTNIWCSTDAADREKGALGHATRIVGSPASLPSWPMHAKCNHRGCHTQICHDEEVDQLSPDMPILFMRNGLQENVGECPRRTHPCVNRALCSSEVIDHHRATRH